MPSSRSASCSSISTSACGAKPWICFSSHSTCPRHNRREIQLKARVAIKALAPLLLAIGFAWPVTVAADPAPTPTYRQAVEDALNIVSAAHTGDVAAAQKALAALEAGTRRSQPEIVADLAMRPPEFEDAGTSLP